MARKEPDVSGPIVAPAPAHARPGVNAEIRVTPVLGGGALVRDYVAGVPALAPFFGSHYSDIEAYRRKATEVDGRLDAAARQRLGAAIRPLGDAAPRLRSILDGNGWFVTTGQQPALFGGPLYSLYKALSAIRLADALERRLGRPVLALFWIGADDHDWNEANHAVALDAQNYVHRVTLDAPADAPPMPMSERRLGPGITRALEEFEALLPHTEFSDDVVAHLREAYTPDATVADAFAATLEFLLRDRRIAVISSAAPELRRAAVPVLRSAIVDAAAHNAAIERQTRRLVEAGWHAQVATSDDATNVMLIDEHGRDRLVRRGEGWQTRREKRPLSGAEVLAMLDADPARFSPNVLLRPVVENAVLPTIAYVAGPGEISYFAQIGCLFAAYGILPPVVAPRWSITVIEGKVRKVLDKSGLEPAAFGRPFQELVTAVIRQEMPEDVAAALASLRDSLHERYEALKRAASAIDPTLAGPLTAARNSGLQQTHEVERRLMTHLKRRNETMVEQLRKAAANLYPDGAAQERVLSPLAYVARYGRELVASVEASIEYELAGTTAWAGPDCG